MSIKYTVVFDQDAISDLESLRAYDRRAVVDVAQRLLSTEPTRISKSRIKRLRDLESLQYRLRVGEFRVLYDVFDDKVLILRVLAKADVDEYLREMGHEIEDSDR